MHLDIIIVTCLYSQLSYVSEKAIVTLILRVWKLFCLHICTEGLPMLQ